MTIPLSQITVTDPFWLAWQQALIERGLAHQWRMCEETGRLENFRRAAAGESGGFQGLYYNDSDVYKLLEATVYAAHLAPASAWRSRMREVFDLIASAQMPDGYIHTFFQLDHPEKRFLSLAAKHEMYCMGHLIEACCAAGELFRDETAIGIARRVYDCLNSTFGPGKRLGFCGHQELELALCRLSDLVGDEGPRELAKWMTDRRGERPSPFEAEMADPTASAFSPWLPTLMNKGGKYDGAYAQDDKPLREQTQAVGHAVRAMYQFCGALDAYGGSDARLMRALETIWSNLTERRMYVTGGIGSSHRNEGFTADYDLPNRDAYAETCAGIGVVFWGWRMGVITGEAAYFDEVERSLYNGVISGMSFDAETYHYVNPLETDGTHVRKPWFDCACCPPNIARLVLSVGRYIATRGNDGQISINLPIACEIRDEFLSIEVDGSYPWHGDFRITADRETSVRFRRPGFANPDGRARYETVSVRPSVVAEVSFPVRPKLIRANPKISDNLGKVAVMCGPLVYCLEGDESVRGLGTFQIEPDPVFTQESHSDPRRKVTFHVRGRHRQTEWPDQAYLDRAPVWADATVEMVPYFAWKSTAPMQVWIRELD